MNDKYGNEVSPLGIALTLITLVGCFAIQVIFDRCAKKRARLFLNGLADAPIGQTLEKTLALLNSESDSFYGCDCFGKKIFKGFELILVYGEVISSFKRNEWSKKIFYTIIEPSSSESCLDNCRVFNLLEITATFRVYSVNRIAFEEQASKI
jgi:hypothetical protein